VSHIDRLHEVRLLSGVHPRFASSIKNSADSIAGYSSAALQLLTWRRAARTATPCGPGSAGPSSDAPLPGSGFNDSVCATRASPGAGEGWPARAGPAVLDVCYPLIVLGPRTRRGRGHAGAAGGKAARGEAAPAVP